MKKISDLILKSEEVLAGIMLCMIAVLVFWSAVARTIGMPVNWAQDVSLLAFAWLTFIGSDIIIKGGGLIRIDMLVNKNADFREFIDTINGDIQTNDKRRIALQYYDRVLDDEGLDRYLSEKGLRG